MMLRRMENGDAGGSTLCQQPQLRFVPNIQGLLPHTQEGAGIDIVHGCFAALKDQSPVCQLIAAPVRIPQPCPPGCKGFAIKGIPPLLLAVLDSVAGTGHGGRQGLSAVDHRPAFLVPHHGGQHGFPADVMQPSIGGTDGMGHHPPVAIRILRDVGVAHRLEGTADVIPVAEDGIVGTAFKGAPDIAASGHGDHMAIFRAAFSDHQVIPAVLFVHMRCLRTAAAGAVPDDPGFRQLFTGGRIQLELADALGIRSHDTGSHIIHLSVLVPEQGRIDALVVDPDRLRPGAKNVFRRHQEIAAMTDIGGDHVEFSVVIPQGRGINTAGNAAVLQRKLAVTGQNMADLLPVHQIPAVPQGNTGEIFKGTGHQVVIFPHPTDAGVGIETGDNGVFVSAHSLTSLGFLHCIPGIRDCQIVV